MIEDKIAKRYAQALIELARVEKKIDEFGHELTELSELMQKADLLTVLSNHSFESAVRLRILDAVLEGFSFAETVVNFLRVLIRKGRMGLFLKICTEYQRRSHVELSRKVMTVVSASELKEEFYRELSQFFSRKTGFEMIVNKKVEEAVLGGVKVCIGDEVYDDTLRRQLEELRANI